MVHFDEARQLMDEMMKVTIFQPSEKRRMLGDERKTFMDPNLIMDARHKIFRESLSKSPAKSAILAEARKLLTQEETRELQLKREQIFIERELRKFEQELQQSRPKCCGPYICSRKNIANSDDEDFWRMSSRVKRAVVNKRRSKITEQKVTVARRKQVFAEVSITESKDVAQRVINEIQGSSFGNIKVTIKDKPSCESEDQEKEKRSRTLKSCFEVLRQNAQDKLRLRELKTNVQSIVSRGYLRRCVRMWRTYVENEKKRLEAKERDSDVHKIDTLVETIAETQKELTKHRRAESKRLFTCGTTDSKVKKRISSCKPIAVESPAQNRLNAQKEIIRKQKLKLTEQSKLIDELRLKQVQEEITQSGKQTVNAAKETLMHCGQQTRRTLIQLMRQAGYRDKSLTVPLRMPSPPRFLARMEARAEARRSRIKLREEARQKKLEDERRQEEVAKREEERERRRLQQEALREARRLREEREQQRAREIERCKKLNFIAEAFYRKYLLRRYIIQPFIALVETKNNCTKRADDHYEQCLLHKAFARWKMEAEHQERIRIELATSLYDKNLLWRMLQRWKEVVKQEKKKEQVARDFSDMKLQNGCFKLWKIKTVEYKMEYLKKEYQALEHYEKIMKIKYFGMWKRYPKIVPNIIESERIKDAWREIVQEIVPDFDPKQRGVMLED